MNTIQHKPEIIHIPETNSTNTYLKELIEKDRLKDGTIVCTDFQLAGRGQRGNFWESESGQNLLFSIIIHPCHIDLATHFIISKTIAVAIVQTLDGYVEGATIKWPNDIYYGDKKLAGILIENELDGGIIINSIIGVGLNVNQTDFKSDAPNPISLKQIVGEGLDRQELLKQIQEKFLSLYDSTFTGSNDIDALYRERLFRKAGYHKYKDTKGNEFEAKIKNVEENGFLVLELKSSEIKKFAFKEVAYII